MIWWIAAGALVGAGITLLLWTVLFQPSLATRLAAVDAAAGTLVGVPTPPTDGGADGRSRLQRMTEAMVCRPGSRRFIDDDLAADLDLLGIPVERQATHQVIGALTGLLLTPVAVAGLAAAGLPSAAGAGVCIAGVGVGVTVPIRRVKAQARQVRRTYLATVVAYLDLVAMRTASGSGVAEALRDAAMVGDGPGWRRLRAALQDARTAGQPPASALARLGSAIALPDLVELAAQLDLVDATGAQSQNTLRAKADALRSRLLADLHGTAEARNTSLMFGHILMAMGYLILVGYPAVRVILDS